MYLRYIDDLARLSPSLTRFPPSLTRFSLYFSVSGRKNTYLSVFDLKSDMELLTHEIMWNYFKLLRELINMKELFV